VNINRQPLWGRNFEGYGEDPYLTARMGVAYIEGVQSEKVIPSVSISPPTTRSLGATASTRRSTRALYMRFTSGVFKQPSGGRRVGRDERL